MPIKVEDRVSAADLREDWRRKLGVENDPTAQIDVTLKLVETADQKPVELDCLLDARLQLGLQAKISPEARSAELTAARREWDG